MSQVIPSIKSKFPTMSSIDLVDFINSEYPGRQSPLRHDHFMTKVPRVLGLTAPEFLGTGTYVAGGVTHTRNIYNFPKREACLMAMSYSYDLQAKVFDRMTELEGTDLPQIPTTLSSALRLAADQAEQIEQQQKAIEQSKPAVEFVDRYVTTDSGSKGFRQVAKLFRANERDLRQFLADEKIMYRLAGEWMPYGNHIEAGRFEVKTGVADNEHAFNAAKFTAKGIHWLAGQWAVHNLQQEFS